MVKKVLLIGSSIFLLAVFGCKKSEQSISHESGMDIATSSQDGYAYLYDTKYLTSGTLDLSLQDLVQLHEMIASIYEFRSKLQEDWKNRDSYSLDRSLFSNDYIYQRIKMYFYEFVHYLSPEENEYTESPPYVKNIHIIPLEIVKESDLFLIPVIIDGRASIDREDTDEKFFIVKRGDQGFAIVNFNEGYEFDKDLEIYSRISEYTEEDWSRNPYNEQARAKMEPRQKMYWDRYVEFIQSDMSKEEYLQKLYPNDKDTLSSKELF